MILGTQEHYEECLRAIDETPDSPPAPLTETVINRDNYRQVYRERALWRKETYWYELKTDPKARAEFDAYWRRQLGAS